MSNSNSPSASNLDPDRLEAMRRANLAFDAMEQGTLVPDLTRKDTPTKSRKASAPAKQQDTPAPIAVRERAAPIRALGLIESSDMAPPVIPFRKTALNIMISASGSAFEQLKMGQMRLGRNVTRITSPHPGLAHLAAKSTDPLAVKVLDKESLQMIERETRLKMVVGSLETVSKYYKTSIEEIEAEKIRLANMSPIDLGRATMAYEFAANQVLIVTNDEHARKTAMESTKELRKFYEDNGSTEIQVESEIQELKDKTYPPQKKARMRKG